MSCARVCSSCVVRQFHVFSRSEPPLKAVLRKFEGLFERVHVRIEQLLLLIEAAKGEIIRGQFGMEAQTNCFQISGAGLGLRAARFHTWRTLPQASAS